MGGPRIRIRLYPRPIEVEVRWVTPAQKGMREMRVTPKVALLRAVVIKVRYRRAIMRRRLRGVQCRSLCRGLGKLAGPGGRGGLRGWGAWGLRAWGATLGAAWGAWWKEERTF